MVNPSSYGGFLLCILLFQLALLFGKSTLLPLPRWAQGVNVAILSLATLMTISRSAMLGIVSGLLVLVAFYRMNATIRIASFTLLITLAIGAVTYWRGFSPDVAADFWYMVFSETGIEDRMDINGAAMDMLRARPANALTGIGVGTFFVQSEHRFDSPYIIHNEYIWLLVETGIVGLCLFGGIVLRSLQNCVRVSRSGSGDSPIAVGVACGLVGTLAWMLGTEGLWHRHVWLLLALSELCYRLHKKDRLSTRSPRIAGPRLRSSNGVRQPGSETPGSSGSALSRACVQDI
jgi:O-antigen ligase